MATAGSERGLSLRSPARYSRAADRLVDLYAERTGRDPDRARRSADAVARAWMDAEAYRLNTLWTATRVLDGGSVGPEASANKIHWSETDLAIHRAALDLLGPEAELHGDGSTPRGSTATCSPWPGPSTPAPTRSSGTWWPSACSGCPGAEGTDAMHFAFTDQQLEFRDAVRQVLAKECTTADVRPAYDAPTARSPRWATLAELGVTGLTVPEAHGGLGLGLVDLVPLVEEAGRVALPEPLGTTTGIAAPCWPTSTVGGRPRPRPIGCLARRIAVGRRTAAVADARPAGAPVRRRRRRGPAAAGAPTARRPRAPRPRRGATVAVTPVPSLDPTRRLGIPAWEPSAATAARVGDRRRRPPSASTGRPGRRGRRGRAPRTGRRHDRAARLLRQGPPAVRQAHRQLPGRQAPAGRGPGPPRVRPARWSTARPGRSTTASPTPPGRRRWPRPTRRRRPSRRPGCRCRSTGPSATRGSATSTSSSSGPGPWPRPGDRPADHRARLLDSLLAGR